MKGLEDFINKSCFIITEPGIHKSGILVVDFRSKSYKGGGSVIPHLQDTFKKGDSYQLMTQAIGQELLLTTLHPLPAGSRIMGGQGESQHHLGWGNLGQPPRLDCF
jgi:hypothetical protein